MSYYLYLFIIIFALINQFYYHKYEFVNLQDWINSLNEYEKPIYVINDKNYCIESSGGLIYNNYKCVQNIIPVSNYLNISEYNINQVHYLTHDKNSFNIYKWIIIIICLYYFIRITSNIFHFFFKIKNKDTGNELDISDNDNITSNSKSSNSSNSSSSSMSIFDDLFGNAKSNFEVRSDPDPTITIDNFIGCANIKKEINKLINQIKNNHIYKEYGCELPKGLLLIGNPGCGKTHLVKTIINATGMKYIFTSGSDINKSLVGSGSNAITQIFNKARENKPCLIFFDEADTILKKRSYTENSTASIEFGATICKLLAEMDSLKTESGIIVVFATNMDMEYIDKGIMRSGRIDQIIHINNPTFEERIDLFKMYLGKLLDYNTLDLNKISKLSYGLTGSDIKKIINSLKIKKVQAIIENNNNNESNQLIKINDLDIDIEISKCIMGMERERKINPENKKIIAYHEAGHAIMAYLISNSVSPSKICISINSKSLGYTLFPEEDDDLLLKTSIKKLLIEVMILYAGRAAEKIFIGEVTCGGEDDYMKARRILKRLLMNGMIIPEYNFIEKDHFNNKIPEYIETKLININKIILIQVENLLNLSDIIVHKTANKIIEMGSINSDDIDEIFKQESKEDLINSYNIIQIYDLIVNN